MTIAKRFLPFIILLIAVLMCLSACGDKNGSAESDDALSMLLEIIESEESSAATEYYVIVIPSGCSSELALRAAALADEIEEMTGIESVVEYDSGDNPRRDNAIEIMLGNTARNASKVALAELRSGDYLCKKLDGGIVIGGLSDESTIAALDRFEKDVLPYADAEQLMSSSAEFEYFAEYKLDKVSLCGFSIGDFDILCDLDDLSAKGVAASIKQRILTESGYSLEIKDLSASKRASKEIIVSLTASVPDRNGRVTFDGEDVTLCADNSYALEATADYFCSVLLSEDPSDEICTGTSWSERIVECFNEKLVVAQVIFDEADADYFMLDLVSGVIAELRSSKPHVLIMSAMTEQTLADIRTNLPEEYGIETFADGNSVGAVMYLKGEIVLSLDAKTSDGICFVDISFGEKRADRRYDMTYIASSKVLDLDGASEIIDKCDADAVIISSAVASGSSLVGASASALESFAELSDGKHCVAAICLDTDVAMSGGLSKPLSHNGSELRFATLWSSCAFNRISYNN